MNEQPVDLYAEDKPAATKQQDGLFTPFSITIILGALLMLGVVAWGIYQNSLSQPQSGTAPNFALPLIGEDGDFSLAEQRGKVVVVNFWGSWCKPCEAEAPMLQRTWEEYQDRGVVFVGVAVKDPENKSLEFMQRFNITYPNVSDVGGKTEKDYRTQGVPETFVVDRDGKIVKFFFAQPRESELRAVIEEALGT